MNLIYIAAGTALLLLALLVATAFGVPIGVVNASISAILVLLTGLLVVAATQQYESMRQQTVSIFLQIGDRWSTIYKARNAILHSAPVTLESLSAKYGHDYAKLLESEEWEDVRAVCNFFEIAGYLLRSRYINRDTLFMLVSVDAFESLDDGQQEGAMYIRLKGYIEYLRRVYHKRIYDNYDQYLLPEYKKYVLSWSARGK